MSEHFNKQCNKKGDKWFKNNGKWIKWYFWINQRTKGINVGTITEGILKEDNKSGNITMKKNHTSERITMKDYYRFEEN